jgi:tetratricopeptide (TPR) repeat protein
VYWNAQELKALGNFVIDDIVPDDATATAGDVARAYYYRGMAYLFLGENFSYAPVEEDGSPVPASQLLSAAVTDLSQAATGGGETGLAAQAALARAYRWQGDKTNAASAATQVLSADPDFLVQQAFDANSVDSSPYWYLVGRALQEMQPSPKVDFLDPKYMTRDDDIPVAKAEEMHLILAEIALANTSYEEAKGHLGDAIRLAKSRPTMEWIDDDARSNADLTIRPRDSEIDVRADADSPYRSGLIQDRFGAVTTQYIVSGTSLDADSVEALPTADPAAIWHALWLARQEILFLEGRRMADLGIRLPIMKRELEQNPSIDWDAQNPDGPGETPLVPSYIPAFGAYDLFSPQSPYDAEGNLVTTQVTMDHDMNRILTQNSASPFQ